MASSLDNLILFTRFPIPGKTKTRLASALGFEGACDLHRIMAGRAVLIARNACSQIGAHLQIIYEGGDQKNMKQWLGNSGNYRTQRGGDLGVRMDNGFKAAFEKGAERVVIVGTDCPGINASVIGRAFESLLRKDIVLGPACDGGYYLIGLRSRNPALFSGVRWGTSRVLEQTLRRARSINASVDLLETLEDIDRPEDIPLWEVTQRLNRRIAVIIPTLNDESYIGKTLSGIRRSDRIDVVVVDGGSQDETKSVAQSFGARIIDHSAERACQMNAGALAVDTDTLLFLHADTQLPIGFDRCVEDVLVRSNTVAGAFGFLIEGNPSGKDLIEATARWRSRFMQLPYGNQAIFLRTKLFWELGGFSPMPILEDFDLVRRLQKRGSITIADASITTSDRKWRDRGFIRTTLINQATILSYHFGVSLERLNRFYILS